jgi:hypothetical protein
MSPSEAAIHLWQREDTELSRLTVPLVLAGLDLRDDMISSRPSALPTHQLVCVLADVRPHRAQAALANVDANK